MLNPKFCPKCGGEQLPIVFLLSTYHVDVCPKCGVPYEVEKPKKQSVKKEVVKKKPIEKKVMKKTVRRNP